MVAAQIPGCELVRLPGADHPGSAVQNATLVNCEPEMAREMVR